MDSYTFALVLGGAGLVAMAAIGAAHLGHSGGHGHSGDVHVGHGHGQGGHSSHGHVTHGHGHSHSHGEQWKGTLLTLVSPRILFTLLFAFGALGLLARHLVAGVLVPVVAVIGAVLFERFLVSPVWNLMFRFASNPATTLEGSMSAEARAATGFDANGHGLVAVEVDGQIVQCLGTLRAEDRALGVRVRAGDVLRVEDVDAARQRCTVAYVGHVAASE